MSLAERRLRPRFPSHTDAAILLKGAWCNGTLIDCSLSGALFDLGSIRDGMHGKACLLRLSECKKLFNGLIVHSQGGLLGIKFIGIGQIEHDALMHIIADAQTSTEILDRDVAALLGV